MPVGGWPSNISWSNFSRVNAAPGGVNFSAFTKVDLTYAYSARALYLSGGVWMLKGNEITIDVKLNKSRSWAVTADQTGQLLDHEAGHWNIAGLVAYEAERSFQQLRDRDRSRLQHEITRRWALLLRKLDRLNKKYDSKAETDHGADLQKQAVWDKLIDTSIRSHYAPLPEP